MTEVQAAQLVAALAAAFPDGIRALDESQQLMTLDVYRRYLEDLPYAAADGAVRRLIATFVPTAARRWPAIAEIRSAVALQVHGRMRTGVEAWGELRKLGARARPESAMAEVDQVVLACADALGWVSWETVNGERRWRITAGKMVADEVSDRARFVDDYDSRARRRREDVAVGAAAPALPNSDRAALPERSGEAVPLSGIFARLLPDATGNSR